jgi:RNA polymerase sigma factor (TIGR02999 family)
VNTLSDLFQASDGGDGAAAGTLFAALYDELHSLAEAHLRRAGAEVTLGTTTLLHEAYFKLAGREGARFPDRKRFFGYASKALRGLVIDYVRSRRARKRGGEFEITRIGDQEPPGASVIPDGQLEELAQGLEELARVDADLARLVDLHFFSGFSLAEVAELEGWSLRTTQRNWQKARLVLRRLMGGSPPQAP